MEWQQVLASRSSRMKASEIRELLKLLDQPDILSFAGGIPDPSLFPTDACRDAFAAALANGSATQALQYSVSEGHLPLRQWIAGEMAKLAIPCDASNILITSGSQQALDYLGKLMITPCDTVLVTWPTYLGALGAFNAYEPTCDRLDPLGNRTAAEIPVQAQAAGGRVKYACLSPDFANPTGETLPLAARKATLRLADDLDIAVVEDAAYQVLRYDGDAVPPLLALDIAAKGSIEDSRIIYCGSFSKSLAPGLRFGWVCAARAVIGRLVLMKQAADLHTSSINQIVTDLVARAIFDPHAATLRATYSARRDAMLAALAREMPQDVTWTRPEGGMFIWPTLPERLDGTDLPARSLAQEKVAFVPGRAFFADGSNGNTLRLSFSCATPALIDEGIRRLGQLIRRS